MESKDVVVAEPEEMTEENDRIIEALLEIAANTERRHK
jgi:hypothetical protein